MTISRRNLLLICGALLAATLFWLWPGSRREYRNLPPRAAGPWVAFGDSLTEGYGASGGMDYPSLLRQRLGVEIRNLGVSGETSADGLKRLPDIEALDPRVVLLCFGGNDVLQNLSRQQMFSNVGTMIDRLQARGTFVVLIGIRGPSLVGDANAKGFSELAREKGVLYIPDMLDGVLTHPALMSDYIHPNDAGYERIAARIEKELRPVLAKLR